MCTGSQIRLGEISVDVGHIRSISDFQLDRLEPDGRILTGSSVATGDNNMEKHWG